jgi:phage shock protein A
VNPLRKLEAMVDALLSSAEDPEERIRQLVTDLRRQQQRGRHALGIALSLELKLLGELCAAEDEREAWDKTTKAALESGDEARAQSSAARVLEARAKEEERRARYEEQRAAAARVRGAVQQAARRIEEVAHARSVVLARARCAEAMQSITATLEVLRSPEVVRALGEAELSAERKEAEAVKA